MAQETTRKGGKWEAAGFGLCALGVVMLVSGATGSAAYVGEIGAGALFAGLAVFLVGRFM
jgi:hypothetical protein